MRNHLCTKTTLQTIIVIVIAGCALVGYPVAGSQALSCGEGDERRAVTTASETVTDVPKGESSHEVEWSPWQQPSNLSLTDSTNSMTPTLGADHSPSETCTVEAPYEVQDYHRQIVAPSPVSLFQTADLGPAWDTNGPVGASVVDFAFDPASADSVYIATYGGGLFRSSDGGSTWDDTPNNPSVGLDAGRGQGLMYSIAAGDGVLYAATSGSQWFHRSTDGGSTWSHVSDGPARQRVRDLELYPGNAATVYAAVDTVYVSTDSGENWSVAGTGIAPNEWIMCLAINPYTPTIMFAGSGNGGIYESVDGGTTWVKNTVGLPDEIVWDVAINPGDPNIVYAGTEQRGVYRSADGGLTWAQWNGDGGLGCPYVRTIAINPSDPDKIFIGDDCWGVFRRSESESDWVFVGPGTAPSGQHRVHALGVSPGAPNVIYAGVWGDGVFKSSDDGQTWSAKNTGLSALNINRVVADPSEPGRAYATAFGGIYRTADWGHSWERILDTDPYVGDTWPELYQDAFGLGIDPNGKVYVGMYQGTVSVTADGETWENANEGIESECPQCTMYDIAINPVTPTVVYAGTYDGSESARGVFKTRTGGAPWTRMVAGLLDTEISALAVDPHHPEIVYAGTKNGRVFRSVDGGEGWNESDLGILVAAGRPQINAIEPASQIPGRVYLAQSNDDQGDIQGGVYRSNDYGATWERVLAGHDPSSLVIHPNNPNVLVVSNWDDGLYRSEDGGDTWFVAETDDFVGQRYVKTLSAGSVLSDTWSLYAGTGTNGILQRDFPVRLVTIGLGAPLTGDVASFGQEMQNAALLALKQINSAGGVEIGGEPYTITLVVEDDACSDTQASVAAASILAHEPAAVIGHACSKSSLVAAPVYEAAGVTMLSPLSTNPDLTARGYQYVFRNAPNDGLLPGKLAGFLHDRGLHHAALLIHLDSAWNYTNTLSFEARFTQLGGSIAVSRTMSGAGDISPALDEIAASDAEVVVTFDNDGALAADLSAAAHARGLGQEIAWMGTGSASAYVSRAGTAAEGNFGVVQMPRYSDMPGYATFEAQYRAEGFAQQPEPSVIGALTYDAVKIVAKAVAAVGPTDPTQVRDAVRATSGYEGVVGVYEGFDSRGDVIPQWGLVAVVQDGEWIPAGLRTEFYPDQGGTLDLGAVWGDVTSVEIPPEALPQTLVVTYTLIATDTHGVVPTQTIVGDYAIQMETNVVLNGAVTVTIRYEDADVAGLDESTLELYTWDGAQWVLAAPCGGYVRDLQNNILRVIICHFSEYLLVAEPRSRSNTFLPIVQKNQAAR